MVASHFPQTLDYFRIAGLEVQIARLQAENERLREALRRLLMDGVQECDPWDGHCDCSTFAARALLDAHLGRKDPADDLAG